MGPKETLNTIQNLYERHKVLTYPRTDSNYLTDDMVDTIKERLYALLATDYKSQVKSLLGQSYSSKMRIFKNHKVSDHHAIIPTEVRPDMQSLSNRESKIYMMVERFLESLMAPHEYEAVRVNVTVGQHIFAFNEKVTRQLGYKALKMNNDNVVKKVAFQKEKSITFKV